MPILVIDTIKQKNNGKFAIVEAKDVSTASGKDLETVLNEGIGGGGSAYVLPQATDTVLGGIKAKAKTTEDKEVAIDTASGKLYVASDKISVDNFESGNHISITSGTGGKVKIDTAPTVLTADMLGTSVAPLNSEKKIDSTYLPSYVDDVVEGYLYNGQFYVEVGHSTLITASASKIYVDLHTNKTYRWSGSAYVEISSSLALGETSTTAYYGDKGKKNADDIASLTTRVGNVENSVNGKQDTLASGTNIKTINGQTLLGSGDITIQGGTATIDYATNEEVVALFGGVLV